VAGAFTLAAIALPCVAWYVTGSRAARAEADRMRREPRLRAELEARRIADRVGARLEALRLSETRRSFLDYRTEDAPLPGVACEPRLASPLAQGPADPLIWAHFQIDDLGRLTLPTLAEGPQAAHAREVLAAQQSILETLECAPPETLLASSADGEAGQPQVIRGAGREWEVEVGPFRWVTVALDGRPALVAIRAVRLPTAALSQGFAVQPAALSAFTSELPFEAVIRAGLPDRPAQARLPLEGADWTVAVDASTEISAAEAGAADLLRRFRRTFAVGVFAAMFAGGLVVSLVWQADRLAAQRARFAASAAHELRTPLAGLRMYGEMLADGPADSERGRRYARRIAGEAERLGRVVANLLGFSRLERGELVFDSASGDLAATIETSIEQLRPALEVGGARIEVAIDPGLPEVRFNRDAVHQILQNLLDNAEKYARSAKDRRIGVTLAREGSGVRLSVDDRGPGLDPGVRRSLFRPFVRHAAPDAPAGLGLGLAIVKALAEAQDAEVSYTEGPGGGARFSVVFRGGS
jgi:signal transduction histidine kinase